ncbi:MAG: hypothetical protein WB424_04790 [Terracidiphilus sp.]|jgi:hypothetical protein
MSTEPETEIAVEASAEEASTEEQHSSSTLKVIGWLSVGIAVAALGVYMGRELRNRYKFNRRTPYDFYDHATGKEKQAAEFGLGI